MLCYVGANQIAVFVVVHLLNRVSGGDNASTLAFNNVYLLTMMAHGIIGVSVMTALLPQMSAAAADGRFADVSADLSRGIRLVATALAPIAVVYGVLGVPIAVTLFQGGAYTPRWRTRPATCSWSPPSRCSRCRSATCAPMPSILCRATGRSALINLPVVAVRILAYLVLVRGAVRRRSPPRA